MHESLNYLVVILISYYIILRVWMDTRIVYLLSRAHVVNPVIELISEVFDGSTIVS